MGLPAQPCSDSPTGQDTPGGVRASKRSVRRVLTVVDGLSGARADDLRRAAEAGGRQAEVVAQVRQVAAAEVAQLDALDWFQTPSSPLSSGA
jgi:hypothetical protein